MQSELKISFNKYIKVKQYSMNKEKEKTISLTLNLDFYYIVKNISFEYIKLTKNMYLKVKKTLNKILCLMKILTYIQNLLQILKDVLIT